MSPGEDAEATALQLSAIWVSSQSSNVLSASIRFLRASCCSCIQTVCNAARAYKQAGLVHRNFCFEEATDVDWTDKPLGSQVENCRACP